MAGDKLSPAVMNTFVHLARQHGVDTSLEAIQRRYAIDEDGLADTALVSLASDLRLEARWTDTTWSQLPKLRTVLPAMLLLRDGTALILESITDEHGSGLVAQVRAPQDTGDAVATIDKRQMDSIWAGRILLLKPSAKLDDVDRPFGIPWLVSQVLRERSLFRDIGIASLINTLFVMTPPFIAMIVIDKVLVNHSVMTLGAIAAILITMVIFEMILSFLRHLFIQITATRIDGRLQLYVMERLLRLPLGFFEINPVGHISGRIGQMGKIRTFLTGPLFTTTLELITLLGLIPALFILNWKLTFWVLGLAFCMFLVVLTYVGPLNRLQGKVVAAERDKITFLIETLQGIKAVKSLALEGRRRRGWDHRVAAASSFSYEYGTLNNYPQTFIIPLQRMIYSGSVLIGAAIVLFNPGGGAPGMLIAFAMLASRASSPLVHLARLIEDLGEVRQAVGEVASVVNVPPEQTRGQSGLRLPIHGAITFNKVNFRYAADGPLALDNCSFEIKPGTIFGIMGRSGSGKTTVTRLLQGLNRNYEGMIKIDGMDLREIDLHHLRTSIGVVPQENFLFSGTVRENIGMAKTSATFAEVVRAAQLAGAEEFIERMPRGYDTYLQEGATNLSGGQRQRIALARALLIDPAVLILDEATSALDAESEAIINANLARIAEDRTIICVSHRLAMLVPSDAILVMEQGRAYDIGRHEELLHRCDIYKMMWHQQNRHLETSTHVRAIAAVS